MARKKSRKKKTHSRRRKMGAVHPVLMQSLELVGGAVAGGVAAAFVNQALKSSFATAPGWTGGAVCIAAGLTIPMLAAPSPMLTGLSAGLAALGGVFAVNESFLSMPGISGMPTGVPNARPMGPGYISQKVGYRATPPNRVGRRMGVLSSGNTGMVGAIYSN